LKEIDEGADGRTIKLSVGERLVVRLTENRTTGFSWEFESNGAPVCELAQSTDSSGERVGEGGVHSWQFLAKRPGDATIKLQYHRPWEEKTPPERTFTLHLSVSQ
jgi:inhibitor of cysteine peptidase